MQTRPEVLGTLGTSDKLSPLPPPSSALPPLHFSPDSLLLLSQAAWDAHLKGQLNLAGFRPRILAHLHPGFWRQWLKAIRDARPRSQGFSPFFKTDAASNLKKEENPRRGTASGCKTLTLMYVIPQLGDVGSLFPSPVKENNIELLEKRRMVLPFQRMKKL